MIKSGEAYFTDLDKRSMNYIGRNLKGMFPENCPYKDSGRRPVDICFECENDWCEWSKPYIEAILSDNIDFKLDDTLKKVAVGDIDEQEAIDEINKVLKENNSQLNFQISLKAKAEEYIHFSHPDYLPPKRGENDE